MKTSIPFEFKRKSMETETTIRSEFQEGEAEQTKSQKIEINPKQWHLDENHSLRPKQES